MADRRQFLARIGALATAPVLTAFVDDERTGLTVPTRDLATAPEPMVISSLMLPAVGVRRGDILRAPHAQILFYVDGEPWRMPVWRVL